MPNSQPSKVMKAAEEQLVKLLVHLILVATTR
jgi:hypothetical protein